MSRVMEIANNLRYIAECLEHLERIHNLPNCHNCDKHGTCEYMPKPGEIIRFNCPLWEKDE